MLAPIITNNITQIKALCETHYVEELYVFGSATTNNFKEQSDVDFLYTMKNVPLEKSADNFFDLLWAFEALFSRKVDMVSQINMKNRIFIEEVNNTKQLVYKA